MTRLPLRLTAGLCSALLLAACASTAYQARTLSGSITLPGALYQQRDIMVRQRLLDVSGSGGAASVLSEQFLNHPRQNPVPYALPYDGHAIHDGGHYEVDTQVYAAGELKLHSVQTLTGQQGAIPATLDVPLRVLTP